MIEKLVYHAAPLSSFATRERLVERVNRLSAALDRLNDGEYMPAG